MAQSILEILLKLTGADKAKGEIKSLDQQFKALGRSLTKTGTILTAGVTAPLVGLGVVAVNAASDLEESMNKVRVVFGESAGAVEDFTETAATSLGVSRQQALESAGTFGNLFTAMGVGREEAAGMSTSLLTLAADLGSFNNIDPTVALDKLRAGLIGEAEPLRTLGVNLTAAAVEAKAMEMGLIEAGEEMTNQELVAARYALIMEQTATAQGDFARTSDGLANSTRIVKAQFQDAAAALGQELLPIGLKIVTWLREVLDGFGQLSPEMRRTIVIIGGIAAAIGPLLIAFGSIASAIGTLIPIVTAIAGVLTGPLALAIAAIIGAVILLKTAWENNWGGIQEKTRAAMGFIRGIIDGGLDVLRQIFEAFKLAFAGDWEGFGAALRDIWDQAWENIKELLINAVDAIKNIDWGQVGTNILQGIANGIRAGAQWAIDAILAVAKAIWGALTGFFKSESPSRLMMELGQNLNEGLALGINSSAIIPANAAVNTSQNVVNNFSMAINTSAPYEPIIQDFNLMKAMNGVR